MRHPDLVRHANGGCDSVTTPSPPAVHQFVLARMQVRRLLYAEPVAQGVEHRPQCVVRPLPVVPPLHQVRQLFQPDVGGVDRRVESGQAC
jgi:hypothetical protein